MAGFLMSNEEYRCRDGISKSTLQHMDKSPQHYLYNIEHPRTDTSAFAFGRACHKYILEKDAFEEEFAVAPYCDRRTKDGKAIYSNFVANANGKEIITREDMEQIIEMSDAIDRVPLARALLTGTVETSFFWTDIDTGIKCKCRPDCIYQDSEQKLLVDYKTTTSCQDGHFERDARKYGYKLQAGMYTEGLLQSEFEEYGFAFVAQEKTAPYAVRVYMCTSEYINQGKDKFRELIGKVKYCTDSGDWYGYEGMYNAVTELLEDTF